MGIGVTFAALYLGVFHICGVSDLPKSDLHFIFQKGVVAKYTHLFFSVLYTDNKLLEYESTSNLHYKFSL